jgi:hypothetical protein
MQHLYMTATEFTRIPKEQLQDLPSMQSHLVDQMIETKEQLYKDVIRQVINREPDLDDFKEVTIATHPDYPTQELIAFKGQPLGRVLFSWGNDIIQNTMTWTFEPIPTFKKDGTI